MVVMVVTSVVSDTSRLCQPARFFCLHGISPGQELLEWIAISASRGICLIQGLNLELSWQADSYH